MFCCSIKISIRLGMQRGRWQTTNMTVIAMEARVILASLFLSTFSPLRRRFWSLLLSPPDCSDEVPAAAPAVIECCLAL